MEINRDVYLGELMTATRLIAMHVQKNRSVQQCLKDGTDYAENGEKTEKREYISSYECDPETVDQEFAFSKSRYGQFTGRSRDDDIIAYQIRQSFKSGEKRCASHLHPAIRKSDWRRLEH